MLLAHQLISVFPVSWTKVCLHLCLEHFQLMFYSQVLLTDHSIQCIACNAFIDPFFLCVWLHLYLMCFERIGLLFQISLVHYIPPPVPSSLVSPVSSCSLWIDRINIFLSLKGKAKKYPHPNTKNPSPITPCPSTSSPGKCPCLHLLTSHSLLHLPPRPLVRPTPSLISLHPSSVLSTAYHLSMNRILCVPNPSPACMGCSVCISAPQLLLLSECSWYYCCHGENSVETSKSYLVDPLLSLPTQCHASAPSVTGKSSFFFFNEYLFHMFKFF